MDDASVVLSGPFDDLGLAHVRLLEEAARLGPLHVLLLSDAAVANFSGQAPKFPEAERLYLLQAIRFVDRVTLCPGPVEPDGLPLPSRLRPRTWAVAEVEDNDAKRAYCRKHGLQYYVVRREATATIPECTDDLAQLSDRKRVIVTGCYDWLHSGHIRFFEEVADLGDLYVVLGSDANLRLLKGGGHPLFSERQRQYVVQSIRYVKQALIATGQGWLDAEPEIRRIRPHVYAVNEDGDRGGKRQFCEAHGIEYRVLKRLPRPGLPPRHSTDLRGF